MALFPPPAGILQAALAFASPSEHQGDSTPDRHALTRLLPVSSAELPASKRAKIGAATKAAPTRRQELIDLREEVGQLSAQLEQLQAASAAHLPGSPTAEEAQYVFGLLAQPASPWENQASRELAALHSAQEENVRLRKMLGQQARYVKQLRRGLSQHVKSWGSYLHATQLEALSSSEAARVFSSLNRRLDGLYASVDRTVAAAGLSTLPCPGRLLQARRSITRGVIFELLDSNVVPFPLRLTEKAVWTTIGERGLRNRHGESFDEKASGGAENTRVVAYSHVVGGPNRSAVRSHRAARKFIENGRVVIVCQTHMEPFMLETRESLGVKVLETTLIVVRPSERNPEGTTVVESYVSVTRLNPGTPAARAYQSDDHVDHAASCWSQMKTLDNQLIENLLVETRLTTNAV